jgi:hypothetical protein
MDMIRNHRIAVILEMQIENEKINSIVGMQLFLMILLGPCEK